MRVAVFSYFHASEEQQTTLCIALLQPGLQLATGRWHNANAAWQRPELEDGRWLANNNTCEILCHSPSSPSGSHSGEAGGGAAGGGGLWENSRACLSCPWSTTSPIRFEKSLTLPFKDAAFSFFFLFFLLFFESDCSGPGEAGDSLNLSASAAGLFFFLSSLLALSCLTVADSLAPWIHPV